MVFVMLLSTACSAWWQIKMIDWLKHFCISYTVVKNDFMEIICVVSSRIAETGFAETHFAESWKRT